MTQEQTVTKSFDFSYNTLKPTITISEYGRSIHEMIQKAREFDDDEYRQAFVEAIVELMLRMHPQTKNVEDYIEKIWRHVFRIAQYDLKGVVPPSGVIPSLEEDKLQPERVPYPVSEVKFRHYGHNIQTMIKKAIAMEDGFKKQEYVRIIANYMKMAYMNWNKEHFVNDNIIIDDLVQLSKGKLNLSEDTILNSRPVEGNKKRSNKSLQSSYKQGGKRFTNGGKSVANNFKNRKNKK